jgi:hypothetical protein
MAVSGICCVEYRGSGEPMSYTSREQNYENLPAPARCRQRRIAIFAPSTSFNDNIVAAATGGAMFVATRVLEHSQKNLTGGCHD